MYIYKTDSTISNITTHNENGIIESLCDSPVFCAASFCNLPCCEGLASHLHLLVVCLVRLVLMHTGNKYSTDKSNVFYSR